MQIHKEKNWKIAIAYSNSRFATVFPRLPASTMLSNNYKRITEKYGQNNNENAASHFNDHETEMKTLLFFWSWFDDDIIAQHIRRDHNTILGSWGVGTMVVTRKS